MHGKMTIFNGDETVMCVILCAIFTKPTTKVGQCRGSQTGKR